MTKTSWKLAVAGGLFSLGLCGQAVAVAWTPEPVSSGQWRIEGFADLLTTSMVAVNDNPPFGLSRSIVSDGIVDFSAGFIGMFDAPGDGSGHPVDGDYAMDLQYFRVQIGDTSWRESMPNSGVDVRVQRGLAIGVRAAITPTEISHPDLTFLFPASPGTWEAVDERDDHYAGTVSGTYSLRDGVVPEPATLALMTLGIGSIGYRRRKRMPA